jgi:hypothetical protein
LQATLSIEVTNGVLVSFAHNEFGPRLEHLLLAADLHTKRLILTLTAKNLTLCDHVLTIDPLAPFLAATTDTFGDQARDIERRLMVLYELLTDTRPDR